MVKICQTGFLKLNIETILKKCIIRFLPKIFASHRSVLWIRIRDPGSGAFLTPGSGIRNGFFPDPGFQTHIFECLVPIFWVKNSMKIGPNFFLQHFKNKIVQFCEIYGSKKKIWEQIFFHPCISLLFLDPGSEIRDPGWVKSGSGINIPDPQHCHRWVAYFFLPISKSLGT